MAQTFLRLDTLTGATPTWDVSKYKMAEIDPTENVVITLSAEVVPNAAVLHFKQHSTPVSLYIGATQVAVKAEEDAITVVELTWTNLGNPAIVSEIGALVQLTTPTLTMTAASDTAMDFSWTNVANESSYYVQIAEDSGFTTGVQTATPAADDNAHQFTGLTEGTLYYGRVKAIGNGVNYSDSDYGEDNASTTSSTIFLSNFNGAADDPPAADTGTIISSSNFELDGSGRLRCATAALSRLRMSGALNCEFSIAINTLPTIDETIFILLRCSSDFNDYVNFALRRTSSVWYTEVSRKIGGGSVETILAESVVTPANGDVFLVKIDATTAYISLNGTSVRSAAHGAGAIVDTDALLQVLGSDVLFDQIEGVSV